MTSDSPTERILDLRPHPRILPMLGEINLPQWRCLAELIDNSLDAFVAAERAGRAIHKPQIAISVPQADRPDGRIVLADNGPGMDPATLENAVRAGWTSNDPISSLGLFGMGFNIATARLGQIAEVWSTKEGLQEWYGVRIDFDELVRSGDFKTPLLSRPKLSPSVSGTEIVLYRLKSEQRKWFAVAVNRAKVAQELGRTYSALLVPDGKPLAVSMTLNTTPLPARLHCVWDAARSSDTQKIGSVAAVQPFNIDLGARPYCVVCWQWVPGGESRCPTCEERGKLVQRTRRVHGWLGVQRYLHERDYGIDLLRNGRKIEIGNKDLFMWTGDDGNEEKEYPIDDPRGRGRIVGEIHLDHCRVTYTKDRFERNDVAWGEMIEIIRGHSPLRPEKANELGLGGENNTPLFRLYQAFRRSNPKTKASTGWVRFLAVPDNDAAKKMADRFYAGEIAYLPDDKWFALAQEGDEAALRPPATPASSPGGSQADDFFGADGDSGASAAPQDTPRPGRTTFPRRPIHSLCQDFVEDLSGRKYPVATFATSLDDTDLEGKPWALRQPTAGQWEFYYAAEHPAFRSATLTPGDALLCELAIAAVDSARGRADSPPFARVLTGLRNRYATWARLEPRDLIGTAKDCLVAIARAPSKRLPPEAGATLLADLPPAAGDTILERLMARSVKATDVIASARFLEYAPSWILLKVIELHPEWFFDGAYWHVPFDSIDYGSSQLTEAAQNRAMKHALALVADAAWLAEADSEELMQADRTRLLRAALALELLQGAVASQEDA